ncbi:juvenile hormone esterase-like [Galleria mellonella]|uniref:Carboxylic ester hydrolase n=1 Tax=Galleria mellonella TaxID=7137 RepID=A0A6J1X9Q9_GALME|nr:juvenile hormone esterase-like [Galleria mellonella]
MEKVLLFALLAINYVAGIDMRVDPLVLTKQGLVKGRKASDGDYSEFLGIPYAKVDLENPFGPAQEITRFEQQVFFAYDGSTKCPQTSSPDKPSNEGTLDCLTLNVYVPFKASYTNPLPVLVFIHGGIFSFGSAGEYKVKNLVRHDIVVVTINYRLGPYGFMCLDTPSVPGNQGLKDQYEALRWIRSNIDSFGGNPYNVTLSGQSAGACATLLHLYSSKEKLFHKVIVESGTPQNYGMFVEGDVHAATKIAQHLGLNTTDTEEALEFLTSAPHALVTAAAIDLNLQLRPCREKSFSGVDNFVESDPFSLSNANKVRNTPILIGHTSQEEGAGGQDYFNSDPFYIKIDNSFNMNEEQLHKAALNIKHFYIGDAPAESLLSRMADFESDFVFNHPMQRTITNLVAENAQVYQYMFSYVGDSGADGARHSAELFYLYNAGDEVNQADQLIIDRITTIWANFVKYGNPTPKATGLLPVTWSPVTKDTKPYLVIDTDIRMESRVYNDRMAYWDLFYDNYGNYNKLLRKCHIK